MPKKRQPQSLLTKPSSTAPAALSSARAGSSQDGGRASNVNDLLQQLRISQRTEHAPPQPPTMASVHPSLRSLLDMPETAAPRPRPGSRAHHQGPTRVRRIPGPPPPQSWLLASKHASKDGKVDTDHRALQHQSIKLPDPYLVGERSLQHMCLKLLALQWDWYSEDDRGFFKQIPLRLRETLLSYLSIYRAGDFLSNPLEVLFSSSGSSYNDTEQNETHEARRLDLTSALGIWLSWKKLKRAILVTQSTPQRIDPRSAESDSAGSVTKGLPDSWEEAVERDNEFLVQRHAMERSGISRTLYTSRFPNLRHLSLALDPTLSASTVSWSSLLGIASHLQTLESLSLAYWPLPTYTPEAAATYATIDSKLLGTGRRIAYGGTNMYSGLENDWRESSGILKSLSRSLYCLKWLDLTGCVPWIPALAWEDHTVSLTTDNAFGQNVPQMETGEQLPLSIWNGHWRGIVWLGLGVGWIPTGTPDNSSFVHLAREYNKLWNRVDRIATQVRQKRIAGKGQPITTECGYGLIGGLPDITQGPSESIWRPTRVP